MFLRSCLLKTCIDKSESGLFIVREDITPFASSVTVACVVVLLNSPTTIVTYSLTRRSFDNLSNANMVFI